MKTIAQVTPQKLRQLYRFLPVQLFLLHFRKYQLLLLFWIILITTITGNFASHFGGATLFLAPEYLGKINFASMMLLGGALAMFTMAWHITTFIIHSKRIPFIGAARQSFLKYCINNSVMPLLFLVFYTVITVRFQWYEEHTKGLDILLLQLGFYFGFLAVVSISLFYFFSAGRDLLKTVLAKITNPQIIREFIPYDTLDLELDMIRADTYLAENLKIEHIEHLEKYHPRVLTTILRRHHRNAITATLFALALLILLGRVMDYPALRIPAGAGFLILFSVMVGIVGAIKYFLKSWEMIGWAILLALLSWMVKHQLFDLRSIGYGLNYHTAKDSVPVYDYEHLKSAFSPTQYAADKAQGIRRLDAWKARQAGDTAPPLVVISISGGGSRSAYWTMRSLQYADSASGGKLFKNCVLMTGASGGMIGGTYWRSVHEAAADGKIDHVYDSRYQQAIGKDLLNAIIFSFASVDLVSPYNKVKMGPYSYTKDRGYAMEQELIRNTDGLLDRTLGSYRESEASGAIPQLVMNGTIVNDGRKLLMSASPVAYLTQPEYSLGDTLHPPIDAVDFAAFFRNQDPCNLRLTSALRMNATFPFILPVVKLPSSPQMNVMDAGLRDNFGTEVAARWLSVFRDWLKANTREVIWLQIRDTREYEVFPPTEQSNLAAMMADPVFVIQNKWEPFQSYTQSYVRDLAPAALGGKLKFVTLQYLPRNPKKIANLNFHLTRQEKEDIFAAMDNPINRAAVDSLVMLLR